MLCYHALLPCSATMLCFLRQFVKQAVTFFKGQKKRKKKAIAKQHLVVKTLKVCCPVVRTAIGGATDRNAHEAGKEEKTRRGARTEYIYVYIYVYCWVPLHHG